MFDNFWLKEERETSPFVDWGWPTGHDNCDYCKTLNSFYKNACFYSGVFQCFLAIDDTHDFFNFGPIKAKYLVQHGKEHLNCICAAFNHMGVQIIGLCQELYSNEFEEWKNSLCVVGRNEVDNCYQVTSGMGMMKVSSMESAWRTFIYDKFGIEIPELDPN